MKEVKVCNRCIMDNNNDPDLLLDENGICNHCHNFELAFNKLPKGKKAKDNFNNTILKIKEEGRQNKYDCIIGISGGVDSTYLCYVAKQHNLRPLLVHCDNGWNSELSVKNIENICAKTGFDLYTLVIDWPEIKDIQLSFFKAGVVDIELPYDYALIMTSYKAAQKYGIKYVLTGHNVVTEGTYLPKRWRHDKMDIVNIKAIHKRFGSVPLKTFPYYSFIRQRMIGKKLSHIHLLNYGDYNKLAVMELIKSEFGWRDYGGKHYENIFTRFYQGYILKEKFGFDKRQFHLSVLVQSGQISREEAFRQYAMPAYDAEQLKDDKDYVLKKLGLTNNEFESYMKAPVKDHYEYPSIKKYWDLYFKTIAVLKPIRNIFRKR
jgi:N-acetyl sugar amidotransferase